MYICVPNLKVFGAAIINPSAGTPEAVTPSLQFPQHFSQGQYAVTLIRTTFACLRHGAVGPTFFPLWETWFACPPPANFRRTGAGFVEPVVFADALGFGLVGIRIRTKTANAVIAIINAAFCVSVIFIFPFQNEPLRKTLAAANPQTLSATDKTSG